METTPNAKKVFIYCRTATQHPGDNTALDQQERDCRAFCTAHGLTVVAVTQEVASGAVWQEREQFMAMRARYLQGEVGGIVISRADRLSRTSAHYRSLLEEMAAHNVSLFCVEEGGAQGTAATGRHMLTVFD